MSATLTALERAFDDQLPVGRLVGRPGRPLVDAARRWSAAVCAQAALAGPSPLTSATIDAGVALAARPVFICGAHRSGTTLVQRLLDGHPALSVLPAEGAGLSAIAALSDDEGRAATTAEWLRRLANPTNQPPYWVLGRSTDTGSPYVEFAREVMAWWPVITSRLPAMVAQRPLLTAALAFTSFVGRLAGSTPARRWVDKTPGNERILAGLRSQFPDAVIVHVIRHPLDVLASRKRLEIEARGSFGGLYRITRELAASLRVAAGHDPLDRRCCLIRYEELVADPRATVERLAGALGVVCNPALLQATVVGQRAPANSSWESDAAPGDIQRPGVHRNALTWSERALAAVTTGKAARALGYDVPIAGVRQRPSV